MKSCGKKFDVLERSKKLTNLYFPGFGINKKQQIIRLLFEISKRESISPDFILSEKGFNNFSDIKTFLMRRRFPHASTGVEMVRPYLPKLELDRQNCLKIKTKNMFSPKNILIESSAKESCLASRFKASFPQSTIIRIESLKKYYLENRKRFTIKDYNNRSNTLFIVKERQDFFKSCPCTKGAVGCGYHIFNLSFGCIFECTYCYLQEYSNTPGIIFPTNIDNFFDTFMSYKYKGMRIGTGEFSDSLMLDNITEYSIHIIDFFSKHSDVTFEFKTKSTNIKNILRAKHKGNIVISWSLNPQRIIDENEFYSSTLIERINAAYNCTKAGYKVGFHFDPIIYFQNWQKHYEKTIDTLFKKINVKDIAWISIGTLRFNPQLKKIIEARFPNNKILDEELVFGYDNKLRYPYAMRYNIYKSMIQMLSKHSSKLPVYLCMEEKRMWHGLNLTLPFRIR